MLTFFIRHYIKTEHGNIAIHVNFKSIKDVAIEFKRFPLISVWSSMINIVTLQMPDLLINKLFGSFLMGQYSLANRTIAFPMSFLSTAIQEVFKKSAAGEYNDRRSTRKTYLTVLKTLVIIGILFFLFFIFLAPWLFGFVFGDAWKGSGDIVQIMALLFVVRFIVAPLSYIFFGRLAYC